MAVVEDLSRQHVTEVAAWSRLSRKTTKSASGKIQSVYQHESTKGTPSGTVNLLWSSRIVVLTIESMLAAMVAEE
jgi:hypothetical protein